MGEHSCADCEWLLARTTRIPEIACVIVVDSYWSRRSNGYALLRGTTAHRWFYKHVTGLDLPLNIDVRHGCDIRPCISMDHLSHGTRADNMRDAALRDRTRYEDKHHWAKLDSDTARAIVLAYQAGRDCAPGDPLTQYQIAAQFNVNQATVSRILRGLIWRRATDAVRVGQLS